MPRRISQKPTSFSGPYEHDYWHSAQDIAYRANASLEARGGSVYWIDDNGERLVCTPEDGDRLWFNAWRVVESWHPELARLWEGGRALTPPGWQPKPWSDSH